MTTPVSGFADNRLASLFGVKIAQKPRGSNKGLAVKAGIAASICGVTALLAFGGLLWWWWTKHRAGKNRTMAEETIYYEKSEEPDVPREEQVIHQQ